MSPFNFTFYKSPIHPSKLYATHSRTHWTASITQDTIVYSFPSKLFKHSSFSWDLLTSLKFFLNKSKELLHLRRVLCQNPTERSGVLSLQLPLLAGCILETLSACSLHTHLTITYPLSTIPWTHFPSALPPSLVQVPSETLHLDSRVPSSGPNLHIHPWPLNVKSFKCRGSWKASSISNTLGQTRTPLKNTWPSGSKPNHKGRLFFSSK